jgi:hypothetical protein
MSDVVDPGKPDPNTNAPDGKHGDPLMTLFVVGIILLLFGCLFLILIANSRRPAGL